MGDASERNIRVQFHVSYVGSCVVPQAIIRATFVEGIEFKEEGLILSWTDWEHMARLIWDANLDKGNTPFTAWLCQNPKEALLSEAHDFFLISQKSE